MTQSIRIHNLWNDLSDLGAYHTDDALNHLLAALCELVDAQNAVWFGAVRMADILPGDPVHGWRPRAPHYLHPSQRLNDKIQEQAKRLESGVIDVTTVRNIAFSGTFRVNRLIDLVPEEWFESDYYRIYYRGVGHFDAMWCGCPVNADAEVYFGIFRGEARPRFSEDDRATVAAVLRGLKWFHRAQMLARGLLIANAPLTPAERGVLEELLTGKSEKLIAAALGKSPHTIHDQILSLFRKFGVNNRAALMALWLGRGA